MFMFASLSSDSFGNPWVGPDHQIWKHFFVFFLVFCCVWILIDLWKVQMIDFRFYETKPTDEFRNITSHREKLWLQLQLILKTEYLHSLCETLLLKAEFLLLLSAQMIWFVFCFEFICISSRNGRLKTFMCALLSLLSHDQPDWHNVFLDCDLS